MVRKGSAAGVGVAERVVRLQTAGPLQQHGVTGVLTGRTVHCDGRRRRQSESHEQRPVM